MATVLSVGDSEGSRSCDSRCHEAEPGTSCACVCEGAYHACGSSTEATHRIQADLAAGRFGPELEAAARNALAWHADQALLY